MPFDIKEIFLLAVIDKSRGHSLHAILDKNNF